VSGSSAGPVRQVTELATSAPDAAARAGRWVVLPEASEARFHVRDKLVATTHGSMPVRGGAVAVSDAGDLVTGWVDVSVAGISTGNAHRDKDLRGRRFLDAEHHPAVRVEIRQASTTPTGWVASAVVTARGRQAPVDLAAETRAESGGEIRVRVTGRLDRAPLGIKAPTIVISRLVELEADLVFRRETDAEEAGAEEAGDADAGRRRTPTG
jgi:polyisoprenoid-binding protein YceI